MCQATLGVLGDVCRAVEEQIAPYCDAIMTQLLTLVHSKEVCVLLGLLAFTLTARVLCAWWLDCLITIVGACPGSMACCYAWIYCSCSADCFATPLPCQ